jgi:hypothetical protein
MMDNRVDLGTCLVHRAVYEPLGVGFPTAPVEGSAFERELHHIVDLNAFGCTRPGQ